MKHPCGGSQRPGRLAQGGEAGAEADRSFLRWSARDVQKEKGKNNNQILIVERGCVWPQSEVSCSEGSLKNYLQAPAPKAGKNPSAADGRRKGAT